MVTASLTSECILRSAHVNQQVGPDAAQFLPEIVHRLEQKLGSVVAGLLAAVGCGTKVSWVKAV